MKSGLRDSRIESYITHMHEPHTVRANVLGVGVHAINLKMAVSVIDAAISECRKGYVCVTDVNGVMEAQRDGAFKEILNQSLLTTPDGMPNVWVGKLQGFRKMARVYGPDLMLEVCHLSLARGYSHFLYGGTEGVAQELAEKLTRQFPGIKIVGTYTPPFRPLNASEEASLVEMVRRAKPDIFWVGISTPKQDRMMAAYLPKLETKVMLGVGAAFDIHTGRTKDAPNWMKQAGLQWLFRLAQEPRRLYKRYLLNNPQFIYKIALQLTGLKEYRLGD
jgi:N-acetylglucosaminyldiphosphoundecaprenol N-acetyl-beta-D-mannosaminyltransferase